MTLKILAFTNYSREKANIQAAAPHILEKQSKNAKI